VYNILPSPDLSFAQRRSPPPPLLSIATHRAPILLVEIG
jgi:hypothetical protein